jgi:hypothetical protein
MQGRLNIFQRTMLHWDAMHAYNAVHAVRIPAALEAERLKKIVSRTLESLGLTRLSLDRKAGTYQFAGGPADCDIKVLDGGENPRAILRQEIERHLNLAFASAATHFEPFRFFAVSERSSFWLGLVYFHPVADAEAVALLLLDLVEAYQASGSPARVEPFHSDPARPDSLVRRLSLFAGRLTAFPSLLRLIDDSRRLRYNDDFDLSNGFDCFSLEPESLPRLKRTAKASGVTLNDLFLALFLKCVSSQPAFRPASKRRSISVGCIVNLRKDLHLEHRRTFGLFLGSFVVTHPVPAGVGLRELAADVNRQTLRIKQKRLSLGAPLELILGGWFLSLYSTERRKKLYQKYYPLWGGITNMNMNSVWGPGGAAQPLDCIRGVSTGPATPLVLLVTTAGERINIGLSFRPTVFSISDIERIKNLFLEALNGLEVGG